VLAALMTAWPISMTFNSSIIVLLQKIINYVYRYPKSELARFSRFGGYLSYRQMLHKNKLMMAAALKLPAVKSYPDGLPVYFLTGKKYLYQTLFCIQSLTKVTQQHFNFNLVDDGSFDDNIIRQIKMLLPGCEIIIREIIDQNLKKNLPEDIYPHIYKKRAVYPHLKKLTDIHTIPGNDWKLVLDSDMLFWNEPTEIINWLKQPQLPIHMLDCVESYGYSRTRLQQLCNSKIPDKLNVGIIGLRSSDINWQDIDSWIHQLEENESASYYLEQALTAMLIGDANAIVLDQQKYIVNPNSLADEKEVLHHYVDLSKKMYFTQAWEKLI
jgi:hypothetical protein